MGEQLRIPGTERPPPTEADRLRARHTANEQVRRGRQQKRRLLEARCPACGERVVVLP